MFDLSDLEKEQRSAEHFQIQGQGRKIYTAVGK